MSGIRPWHGHYCMAFGVDGALYGYDGYVTVEQINKLVRSNVKWGILCSRSFEDSLEECKNLDISPLFIKQCEIDHRAPYLRQLATDYPAQFSVYVADRDIDKQEAIRAGWEFYYPHEMDELIHRVYMV